MNVVQFVFRDPTGLVAEQLRTSYMPVFDASSNGGIAAYAAAARSTGLFERVEIIETNETYPLFLKRTFDENFHNLWGKWTGAD